MVIRGRRPRTASRRGMLQTHKTGSGPDSIYVHAIRHGEKRASGPVAVCGHPLRTGAGPGKQDRRSFQERWSDGFACCPDCGAALALPTPHFEHSASPDRQHKWPMIASVVALVPLLAALVLSVIGAAR